MDIMEVNQNTLSRLLKLHLKNQEQDPTIELVEQGLTSQSNSIILMITCNEKNDYYRQDIERSSTENRLHIMILFLDMHDSDLNIVQGSINILYKPYSLDMIPSDHSLHLSKDLNSNDLSLRIFG